MNTVILLLIGLQVVVFAVIVFLFKRLLLSDTMNAVNRIKDVEAEVNKREEAVRRQIEDHEKELTRKREEMEGELERRRAASEQDLQRMKESMTVEAKHEGDEIIARAKQNEQRMRADLQREADAKAVDYAGRIFKLTFSEKVTEAVNREFVAELVDALDEVDAESLHVEANEAEFVSSHPLDAEQKQRLHNVIAEKFDLDLDIRERVDPELLGGVSMKLGTLEIDGSLRSRFAEAAAEIKKESGVI